LRWAPEGTLILERILALWRATGGYRGRLLEGGSAWDESSLWYTLLPSWAVLGAETRLGWIGKLGQSASRDRYTWPLLRALHVLDMVWRRLAGRRDDWEWYYGSDDAQRASKQDGVPAGF